MRKDQIYIFVSLVFFTLVGFYSFGVLAKTTPIENNAFFYVVYSPSGFIKINKNNPKKGELVMNNISDFVFQFVDYPQHIGNKIETTAFLENWNTKQEHSFAHDPPFSAFLNYNEMTKTSHSTQIILSNPRYNDFGDQLIFTIEFKGKPLKQDQYLESVALFVEESSKSQDQ